jgi:hypothetical protein
MLSELLCVAELSPPKSWVSASCSPSIPIHHHLRGHELGLAPFNGLPNVIIYVHLVRRRLRIALAVSP